MRNLVLFVAAVLVVAVTMLVRRQRRHRELQRQVEQRAARARAARKAAVPLVSASLRGVTAQPVPRSGASRHPTAGTSDQAA